MKLGPGVSVAITGASSGIGEELAYQFAARGCAVALAARRADRLDAIVRKIQAGGGRAIAVPTDVSKRSDVEKFMRRAADEFGRLDVVIHNAGIPSSGKPLLQNTEEDFRRVWEVNLMGIVYGVWAAAPLMEKSGGGVMAFVSSIVGKRAVPRAAAYCASKFAIQGLTESLRPELRAQKIRVVTICPPGVDTPFFEANGKSAGRRFRLHPVGKIARKIVRAVERETREVLPTMDAKIVHWSNVFFPRIVDRVVSIVRGDPK